MEWLPFDIDRALATPRLQPFGAVAKYLGNGVQRKDMRNQASANPFAVTVADRLCVADASYRTQHGARMQDQTHLATPSHRGAVIGVLLAVASLGIVATLVAAPGWAPVRGMGPATIAVVTATVTFCGALLGVLVRLLSARAASSRQWLRRASAGAMLLTPATLSLTRSFMARGWDFDSCGSLLARNRPAGADLAGFRAQCEDAAHDRMLRAVIWAGVACAAAGAYGLWLRRRRRQ